MLLEISFDDFIDWKQVLFGDQEWTISDETGLRTIIMFAIVLAGLTILGKRGVKQLSVFELVVIICLGSAAAIRCFIKKWAYCRRWWFLLL